MLLTSCLHSAKIGIKKEKTEQKKGFLACFMQKTAKRKGTGQSPIEKAPIFYPFWIAQCNQNEGGNKK